VIGLSHGFLAPRARATLVTLWRIADRSAADFMQAFYSKLHGGVPPALTVRCVYNAGPPSFPSIARRTNGIGGPP
jgi:CHAT domain